MHCTNCGKEIANDEMFCPECNKVKVMPHLILAGILLTVVIATFVPAPLEGEKITKELY